MLKRLLTRSVVSDRAGTRFGQAICFCGACLVPVLVFNKFTRLDLSEAQLLIGVLATMCLAVLLTLAGVMLGFVSRP